MNRQWIAAGKYLPAGGLVLLVLYWMSLYSYVLFHSFVELFSVAIAVGSFMVVWNSRRFLNNDCFLVIGIAFLFVGVLDLLHALAYKGMGVFHGFDTNLPTQLWIAARYVQSLSLALATLLIGRNSILSGRRGAALLMAGYTAVFGLILSLIFYFRIFPVCYIEGAGLTHFKKVSEYAICLMLAVSLTLLLRHRRRFDEKLLYLLTASVVLTILAELCFTLYISVYGLFNMLGHFLKLVAMYLVYAVVMEIGLTRPFALLLKNVKENETALRESERVFRTVADFTYDWEYWLDHEGNMRYMTPSSERVTGYRPEEFRDYQQLHKKIIHPDDLAAFAGHVEKNASSKEADAIDFRIITRNGEIRWIGHICQPVYDVDGQYLGRRASNRDITEAKNIARRLSEALELNRKIIEESSVGILVYAGASGRCVMANAASARIISATAEQLLQQEFRSISSWKTSGILPLAEEVLSTGGERRADFHLVTTFGREVRLECSFAGFSMAGKPHLLVLLNDITERKRVEEALQESEKRYRTLFENSHSVMLLIDPGTGSIMDANPRACSFYGYRYEELLELKITEINTLTPEQVKVEMERARTGQRNHFNFRHRLASGEIRDVVVYSGPIGIGGRKLLLSVIHDETERRRTEELLRQSEMKYRTIFETTGTATLIGEDDTTISLINHEFVKLSGYSKEEVEGKKSWTEFFGGEDLARMREWHHVRKIDSGAAPRNYEARFTDRSGRIRNVFLTVSLIPGTTKRVASLLDITESRRMEEELLKAHKLESVGILAGGIAHDFNNLLGIILGYINMAGLSLPDGHPAVKSLSRAEFGSLQAKDLVQRFLTVATGGNPVKVRSSIAEVLPGPVDSASNHSPIETAYDVPADLWQVEIDARQIREAILNVVVNAAEAMPRGGTLRIKAENIEVADGGRELQLSMKNGRYVRVCVRDQGIGIPEEDLIKIFDPYFSTKDRGSIKGTGLGLTISHSVISKHGGTIFIESETGVGTSVTIYIPAV